MLLPRLWTGLIPFGISLVTLSGTSFGQCDIVRYCNANPTSLGVPALISTNGNCSISDNDLTLIASPIPNGEFGFFVYSTTQNGGGNGVPLFDGFFCIGGGSPFVRLPIEQASSNQLQHTLDLTNPPQPLGLITAGSTWNFQAFFRDANSAGFQANLSDAVAITFQDELMPTVGFLETGSIAAESDGTVLVPVVLSSASGLPVTVSVFASVGTATDVDDYTLATGSVLIPAGSTAGVVQIDLVADTLFEADETINLVLITPGNAALGQSTHTLTIQNTSAAPEVQFTVPALNASEAGGAFPVEVSLNAMSTLDVTVPYTLSGTAQLGVDYNDGTAGSILIPAGSLTATVDLNLLQDVLYEGVETIQLDLGAPTGATLGGTTTHVVTVNDDEFPPVLDFSLASQSVGEGAGTAMVEVTLNAAAAVDVTAFYDLTGTATDPDDYTDPGAGSVVVLAGQTTATIDLSLVGDPLFEGDETIVLDLTSATNGTLSGQLTHTLTVLDDDSAQTVAFVSASQVVGEASGVVGIGVSLASISGVPTTVPYTLGGAAGTPSDYTDLDAGSVTIPAGQLSTTIDLSLVSDGLYEGDEDIVVTLGAPTGATLGGTTVHTVTITDDDAAPTVAFNSALLSVPEAGGTAMVGVTLSFASGLPTTIPYTAGGTATDVVDYADLDAGSITIPAGQVSGAIQVSIVSDSLHEGDEKVEFVLLPPTGATLGATVMCSMDIVDDDAAPTVSFALAAQSIGEGAGSATASVTLSSVSGLAATIPFTVGGTALSPDDYVDQDAGLVTIPAGQLSTTIDLSIVDDSVFENDETVVLTLGAPTSATLGATTVHTATITDNDNAPTVAFNLGAQSIGEAAGSAAASVTLSAVSSLETIVPYTVGGTAIAPDDFSDLDLGSITIPAGQLSTTIDFSIVDDSLFENDETVVLTLGAPTNATLGGSTVHTATITDNDNAPTVAFNLGAQSIGEAAGSAAASVTLSAVSSLETIVPYTVGGTAIAPDDFSDLDLGSITIPAGQLSTTIDLSIVDDLLFENDESVVLTLGAPTNATLGATTVHTATITDNDNAPTVAFNSAAQSIGEAAGSAAASVTLSAVSSLETIVPYTIGGTAIAPDDFSDLDGGSLTIPAGQLSTTIDLSIVDDSLFENDETVVLTLGAPTNATLGATTVHTATITDNDNAPTVAFNAAAQSIGEAAGSAAASVTLSAVSSLETIVPYTVGGTAIAPDDFSDLDLGSVTIPAGQLSTTIDLSIVDDLLFENDESVVLTLGAPTNATLGAMTVHTATITDNDNAPTVAFNLGAQSIGEAAGSAAASVTLSAVSSLETIVPYTVGGTAIAPDDFSDLDLGSVTIPAGQLSTTVDLSIVDDSLFENDETVVLTLGAPTNATLGGTTVHTATITDNDTAPTVAFNAAAQSIGEAAGSAAASVTLSAVSSLETIVPYSAGGTAIAPDDFSDLDLGSITIPAGQLSTTIDLSIVDDILFENDESVVLTLGAPTNATLGGTTVHTATITDNDNAPTVAFNAAAQSIGEAAGSAAASVTLSAVSSLETIVPYTIGGTAIAPDDFSDLDLGSITIPAGQLSTTIDFSIVDDLLFENDETVVLTLGAPTNATLGATTVHTATITDNDSAPTVAFNLGTQSIGEAAGSAAASVTLSAVSSLETIVPYTVGGTAIAPDDFSDLDLGSITIPAGQLSTTIDLSIVDDSLFENDESVVLTLGAPTNATLGATTVHTATITDNDTAPTVAFNAAAQSIGEAAGSAAASVTLSAVSSLETIVPYSVGGTAIAPDDFSDLDLGSVTIPAGQLSTTIDLSIVDDSLFENDESVVLTLGAPTNATLGATTVHTATITDNDTAPTVAFNAAAQSIGEAAGSAAASVTLSAVSSLETIVPYTIGGTAIAPDDFSDLDGGSLTIPAGQLSTTIDLSIVDDSLFENDETVVLTLGAPTNATLGATTVHTATITDNDNAPTVAFNAAAQSIGEAAGSAAASVTLSAVSSLETIVPYTVGGTAIAPDDFSDLDLGSITIPAGQLSTTIDLSIVDDSLFENDESVVLTLGAPTNATLGATTVHTATITDNDTAPTVAFNAAAQSIGEAAGSTTASVTLSAASGLETIIPFTASGTAIDPDDYSDLDLGSLTIPAGQLSTTVDLSIVDDSLFENDETVVLTLGAPTNATLGATTVHTATITDNDTAPTVAFDAAAQSIGEAAGSTTASVTLSAASGLETIIPFTASGTAIDPDDYSDLDLGSLTIPAGQLSTTVDLSIVDDSLFENDETVVLTLGAPTNATLGATTVHTATITDNDTAPTVAFDAAAQSIGEAAGSTTASVTLSAASGLETIIPFTASGTAIDPDDYSDLDLGSLTIPAGQLSTTVDLSIVDDSLFENDETVVLTLGAPTNATLGATTVHTATITDNDTAPTVAFDAAAQSIGEAAGSTTASVTLSAASGLETIIPFTASGTAIDPDDYSDLDLGSLTIPAGQLSTTVDLSIVDDSLFENDETVVLTLGAPTNATLGATTVHTATITDNDTAPTVAFDAAAQSIGEAAGSATASVTLSATSGLETIIPFTASGTAIDPDDYSDLDLGSLTIPAGQLSTTIDLTIVDDAVFEADEDIIITLGAPTNATLGATTVHTATITENDAQPTVAFALPSQGVAEAAGFAAITVSLSGEHAQDVTVTYGATGSAADPADYSDLDAGSVLIPAGSLSAQIDLSIVSDAIAEGNEDIVLTLAAPANAGLGATTVHTVTILDDDTVTTDDFNRCNVPGAGWTFVDPVGDGGTATGAGAGTTDAHLELFVPGGDEHIPDDSFLPARLQRPLEAGDETWTVKWDSFIGASVDVQGILIEQDTNHWLRFDYFTSGGNLHLYAAETIAGNTAGVNDVNLGAPTGSVWMRIERVGNTWTQSWSTDGLVFTPEVTFGTTVLPTLFSLYAGNAGSDPEFTALVDYVHVGTDPLGTEDGPIGPSFDLTLNPVVGNGSIQVSPDQVGQGYSCSELVTLTAVADPGWAFGGWTIDGQPEAPAVFDVTMDMDHTVTATFVNDVNGPVISNVVVNATQTDATITWTTDEPATSLVDYGLTAGHGSFVDDLALKTSHSILVPALTLATTYHYSITSADVLANSTSTANATFVTQSAGTVITDDFNRCAGIGPDWTFIDPIMDGGAAFLTGAGTQDAWLNLTVPSGSEHVPWDNSLPARVSRPIANTDFSYEFVWASAPTASIDVQGILVEQDGSNWLRFDFYSNGGNLRAFAARTLAGDTISVNDALLPPLATPLRMRISRTGNNWTQSYYDGLAWIDLVTFSTVLTANQLSLYAGNAAGNPASTAQVDTVFNVGAPPIPEDGAVSGATPHTLTTNVTGQGSVSVNPDQVDYSCGDPVQVTAIADPGWLFQEWQGDLVGSQNPETVLLDLDRNITAVFVQDTTPPVILTGPTVQVRSSVVTISWTTDELASSRVEYGLTAGYGLVVEDLTPTTQHSIQLTGLNPSTLYHFRVLSTNLVALSVTSGDNTFTTDPAPTLVNDDFNQCGGLTLDWTYVDPIGDGSFTTTGLGSNDAWLQLTVPAGSEHLANNEDLPPRVRRAVLDTDFDFEVKWDSAPTLNTQIQGLLVEESLTDWIRFDLYSNGTDLNLFVGTTVADSTSTIANVDLGPNMAGPLWMRVDRAFDQWTVSWSTDGVVFNVASVFGHVQTSNFVSLYAGNSSLLPGFTCNVDYIFNHGSAPGSEDGPLAGETPQTLTLQASVGNGVATADPNQGVYYCDDLVTLSATADPGWQFDRWVIDGVNDFANPTSVTMDLDHTVTPHFIVDVVPPVILTGPDVTPGRTSALVTWTTNEPADSLVDYGLTAAYGNFEFSGAMVTNHAVLLTGLTPSTLYHYRVTTTDGAALPTQTGDLTFMTTVPAQLTSDDFNADNLDTQLWTLVDPHGEAELRLTGTGTADAHLELEIPAGTAYVPYGTLGAAHVVQDVEDDDFQLEVKFESGLNLPNQSQGIVVLEDANHWMRFDVYFDGVDVQSYMGGFENGLPTSTVNATVWNGAWPAGNGLWMRLTRIGTTFDFEWSQNGTVWLPLGTVVEPINIDQVGLFVGSEGGNPNAMTMVADYAFETSTPIACEDCTAPADLIAPFTYRTEATAISSDTVRVDWWTDEPSTGVVHYGTSTAYGSTLASPVLAYQHTLFVPGLLADTQHHFRVDATDDNTNVSQSADLTATTFEAGQGDAPIVDIWYGTMTGPGQYTQNYGQLGNPQRWVNINGNATDLQGTVDTITYTLNGGASVPLGIGLGTYQEPYRLVSPGDFTTEIDHDDLLPGNNTVLITATDNDGNQTVVTVTVNYTAGVTWATTTSIDFDTVTDPADVLQYVDGKWALDIEQGTGRQGLRISEMGYDRLLAIGDETWTDYRARMTFTPHQLNPVAACLPQHNRAAMGLGMRWTGHTTGFNNVQPQGGFWPTGAFLFHRWTPNGSCDGFDDASWAMNGNQNLISDYTNNDTLSVGTEYVVEVTCRTLPDGSTRYTGRVWEAGEVEALDPQVEIIMPVGEPVSGSLLIVAHHCDMTIWTIDVEPLDAQCAGGCEDFETYLPFEDPFDWSDAEAGAPPTVNESLYNVVGSGGYPGVGNNRALAVTNNQVTPRVTTFVGPGAASLSDYELNGRMQYLSGSDEIGVMVLSGYPSADTGYLLRSVAGGNFEVVGRGTSITSGVSVSSVPSDDDIWFHYRIEVSDEGTQTRIRARVWQAGTVEPLIWQIDCVDNSGTRRTAGSFGGWGRGPGNAVFDEFEWVLN